MALADLYVERACDAQVWQYLSSRQSCYVLGPHRSGKSSLRQHMMARLRAGGARCAAVDLLAISNRDVMRRRWRLALRQGIADAAGELAGAVLFLDEVDILRALAFPALEEVRTLEAEGATLCLLGAALPADLASGPSPWPERRVFLEDFTLAEAGTLWADLKHRGDLSSAVFSWTGGHPWLTRWLLDAALQTVPGPQEGTADQSTRIVRERLLSPEAPERALLLTAERTLNAAGRQRRAASLELHRALLQGTRVAAVEDDEVQLCLRLAGLAGLRHDAQGPCLQVRNRIYANLFDDLWTRQALFTQREDRSSHPLRTLAEDYGQAVIHLAWDQHGDTWALLFALVELLPQEVPAPIDDGEQRLLINSEHQICVRHVVVPAERGVSYYQGCLRATVVRPASDGTLPEADEAGTVLLEAGPFEGEPSWPNLACVKTHDQAPFLASWHETPRLHKCRRKGPGPEEKWSSEERQRAVDWLHGRLHFRLAEHPELWGGVNLLAPNPVFRSLWTRLKRRNDPDGDTVMCRFLPRMGKDLSGLTLLYREGWPSAGQVIHSVAVERPLMHLAFDHALSVTSEAVIDPRRGTLLQGPWSGFVRSIQVGINMDGPGLTVGIQTSAPIALPALQWFDGKVDEAVTRIRQALLGASAQAMLVDRHLGPDELHFLPDACRVPLRVLTSIEGLAERAGELETALRQRSASARIMTEPLVMGTFLMVDRKIWVASSSLRTLGARGTVLQQVTDDDFVELRDRLEAAWQQAIALADWAKG